MDVSWWATFPNVQATMCHGSPFRFSGAANREAPVWQACTSTKPAAATTHRCENRQVQRVHVHCKDYFSFLHHDPIHMVQRGCVPIADPCAEGNGESGGSPANVSQPSIQSTASTMPFTSRQEHCWTANCEFPESSSEASTRGERNLG